MPILGIDFGTSKSVAAIWQGGNATVIPDLQGHKSMPSLVMVGPDERLYIGWEAFNHPDRYKSKHFTINSIKRQIGKTGETSWGQFKTYPQEISALILGRLKIQAQAYLDQEISQAVIAIPANFDINQRWAIAQAAEIAGLKVLRLLNEASAAILATRLSKNLDGHALVFDFGAGTLDVSIICYGNDVFEVLATAGDDRLGGDDFDQLLYNYLLEQAKKTIGASVELTPMEQLVLKEAAAHAKIELSNSISTRVFIPGFLRAGNNYFDLDIPLKRETFESLCKNLFEQTEAVVKRALSDANLSRTYRSELDNVFLIGGTSRIPHLRDLVQSVTRLKPSALVDPETGVAQGAAFMAGILGGEIRDTMLLNVTPCTFSVVTPGDVATPIIQRNTTIPVRRFETFSTTQDNQKEITIRVMQGEKLIASQNSLVGTVTLTGLPPAAKGIPQIEVIFDIDVDEKMSINAKDKATGRTVQAVMESPYRLNSAQVKVIQRKVLKELEDIRQREEQVRDHQRQEVARNEALIFIRDLTQIMETTEKGLSPRHLSLLVSGKSLIHDYLDWNVPSDKLHGLEDSIRDTCYEAVSMLLQNEWMPIGQSPELIRWAQMSAATWQSPVALDASLEQLEMMHKPTIEKTLEAFKQPLFMGDDILQRKLFEQVKDSTSIVLLLAIILGLFGYQDVRLPGIDISNPDERTLLTIFLLGTLRKGSLMARRRAAKQLFDLTQGSECFFLSEYLDQQDDPETLAWLEKSTVSVPAGAWLAHYQSSQPEAKKLLGGNRTVRQKIYQDAITSASGTNKNIQLAALQNLEELGIKECIPEVIGLLSTKREETVINKLVDLLSATQDVRVVLPLLGLLGENFQVNRMLFEKLEHYRAVMTPEIRRFFDLARKVIQQNRPVSIKEHLFLKKLSKQHPELDLVIKLLYGKK
jgi:molecular chaperone DnaK